MTVHTKYYTELTTSELYKILKLRAEVFVVEQDCPYQDLDDRDLNAWQIWVEDDGEVVACMRVFMYDDTYSQIGRVVTSLKVRGTGVGKMMVQEGVRLADEKFPGCPILIHSQDYATGFYEKFGFRITSEPFMEDGIPHREMIREA